MVQCIVTDAGRSKSKRPKQDSDCTVRTMAIAFDISYDTAYDILKEAGRKSHDGFVIEYFYKKKHCINGKFAKYKSFYNTKYRKTIPEELAVLMPKGLFIIDLDDHVLILNDGVLYDLKFKYSLGRTVLGIWTIQNC